MHGNSGVASRGNDVKYIQCQHCDKKYAASEKLSAAAGKKIRCKHCRHIFKIIIHDDNHAVEQDDLLPAMAEENTTIAIEQETPAADDTASPDEISDRKARPESHDEPKKNTAPVKKQFNIQLLISIMLAFALLTTATVAYLFFYHHELFEASKQQADKQIIPGPMIKPLNITFPKQQPATAPAKAAPETDQNHPHSQKAKSLLEGPDDPSQACRDNSADYWIRARLLATSPLDTATYMELLNQNLNQADEIRHLCKDRLLIARITEAAKSGQIPAWIKSEIHSRNTDTLNTAE